MIQIGARNMQNFSLLKRAGRARKPVLLKRGMAATLEELLMAAEYVMSEGNYQVILCERGIRTFADHTRNTLDLSIVPAVHRLSHLPIIVDPSHGTGKRNKVLPLARAAAAVGADGLMIEVHHQPDKALSDGAQSVYPDQFVQLMDEISAIAGAVHRSLPCPRNHRCHCCRVNRLVPRCLPWLLLLTLGAGRLPRPRNRLPGELPRIRLYQQRRQQHRYCSRPGEHAAGPGHPGRRKPFGLAINPRRNEVYVVNSGSGTVTVINAGTNTVAATIPVRRQPYFIDRGCAGRPRLCRQLQFERCFRARPGASP